MHSSSPPVRFTPSAADLALCEVQQHSDITYRLYDYGRPRELHLDKAVQVAFSGASDAKSVMLPIDCQYFHTELARTSSELLYKPERGALSPRDFRQWDGHNRGPGVSRRRSVADSRRLRAFFDRARESSEIPPDLGSLADRVSRFPTRRSARAAFRSAGK